VLHSEKLLDAFWEGAASAAKEPALLLDERGRVMRMTRDAERMLARGGLDISAGRLRAAAPVEDAALQAIVGRATHPTAPLSGAARVRRADGRLAAILVAYPIARRNRLIGPADAAALLVMVDPLGQASAAALYQEALGLTWREAEVAALLMAGHSPESASACLGISLATVRVHLRKLLAKSGMSRQADLLRLLARIA
jgi:DNA-binding CsgD family transcriptional regulator